MKNKGFSVITKSDMKQLSFIALAPTNEQYPDKEQ